MNYDKINVLIENKYNFTDENKDVKDSNNGETLTGTIIGENEEKEYQYSYIIKLQSENKILNNKKFILNLKKQKNNKLFCGNQIMFNGEYIKPKGKRNYKGFDYSLYLKSQKIYGTIKINSYSIIKKDNLNCFQKYINKFKNYTKTILKQYLDEKQANLCIGLLLGDRISISKEVEEDFKQANLTHMLAVSGSHFMYIIIAVTYINKIIKRKKLGYLITIICIILFMNLTGNTASVVRSGIMAIIVILSKVFYKRADIWTNMSIAILIQVIINPYVIFDIGLQLSYGGVLGIVMFYEMVYKKICEFIFSNKQIILKNKIIKYIVESTSVTISANIIILPIMIYHFNSVSTVFVLSNILAGNLLGIIIIFSFLLIFLHCIFQFLLKPFFCILNILITILINIAHFCATLPYSNFFITTPNLFFLLVLYLFLFLFYCKKRRKGTIAILIIVIIIINLLYPIINSKRNNIILNFIDVGQGDSTLIRVNNKCILIDGGGNSFAEEFDVGEKTLFPYLLDRGIYSLDYILVSHFDSDHCQGLMYLLENMKVKSVLISSLGQKSLEYKNFIKLAKKNNVSILYVKMGDRIKIGDAIIEILYTGDNEITENVKNNNAIVCKLIWNKYSVLFTGDIEELAEKRIIEVYKEDLNKLKSNILKVAHHGSKTSSSKEFIQVVKPQIALIGVGKGNKFGHPSSEVLNRLNNINCKIYRTDLNGEIEVQFNKGINVKTIINKY